MRRYGAALRRAVQLDSGATVIEYGLTACFVALAIIVGATITGNGLNNMFYAVGGAMQNAANAVRDDGSS